MTDTRKNTVPPKKLWEEVLKAHREFSAAGQSMPPIATLIDKINQKYERDE